MSKLKNDLTKLQKKIAIVFDDLQLFRTALTHRSYLNETSEDLESNERLEFLGDAVLEYIVSDHLYRNYPDLSEGKLTHLRSAVVKTDTLAEISDTLELGRYLLLSKGEEAGGGRENISLLADTFEALLGAIYLDQGLDIAHSFVESNLLPRLPEIIKTKAYLDYKSHLQTLIQDQKKPTPTYEVVKERGPDHDKTFYVACYTGKELLGKGTGKSKQQAEQDAAKNALEKMSPA